MKIKDRDRSDVSTGQGTPKTASKQPEGRREVWNRFFLPASEGINLVNTLILNLFSSWYFVIGSPRKLKQIIT